MEQVVFSDSEQTTRGSCDSTFKMDFNSGDKTDYITWFTRKTWKILDYFQVKEQEEKVTVHNSL